MSRDFKQEYEQHMNEQTPDLWARIEANLPVKEAPAVQASYGTKQVKQHKVISGRFMAYGMTAAAALLLCILAVPALRNAKGGNAEFMNVAEDNASCDMVTEAAQDTLGAETARQQADMDEASCEEGFPENGVEVEEEMSTMEYAMANGSSASNAPSADSVMTDAGGNGDAVSDAEKKSADMEELKYDGIRAKVKIIEMFETDGNTLYRAELDGQEIVLIFGEEFSGDVSLLTGTNYELSLKTADENEIWDYVIVDM